MIRILRILEYTYENAEIAAEDQLRWTPAIATKQMAMRSATLQFEAVPFVKMEVSESNVIRKETT